MFGRLRDGALLAYDTPFPEELGRRLASADLALVNLETALCSEAEALASTEDTRGQRHRLVAPKARLAALQAAGVDVASVANNHALDCGPTSLARTMAALAEHGIAAVGAHAVGSASANVLSLRRGQADITITAATLHPPMVRAEGLTPTRASHEDRALLEHVRTLRAHAPAALLIVSLHWGRELAPRAAPHQRVFARDLVAAGANVILGHGPHVLQEIEQYREAVIVYSAGNLHFDMRTKPALVELSALRVGARWQLRLLASAGKS